VSRNLGSPSLGRSWVITLLSIDLLVGSLAAATWATRALFVYPRSDRPTSADAVVVLSGDNGDRLAAGLDLMGRRVAPTLVLAGEPDFEEVARLCRPPQPFEVVCLRPDPDSTRAEARAVGALAAERSWRHVVVVTSVPHVSRSRLLFHRCVDGSVSMVASVPPREARGRKILTHEWLGLLYARTLGRGC
jgi:uncharacterized SAM-binding protein YcdF (DUF218 family)